MGDGDAWTVCDRGERHWGRFGAAGLLLRATDAKGTGGGGTGGGGTGGGGTGGGGRPFVLLQHRAPWSHEGDTWGLPGGARDGHESASDTALREASEEAAIDTSRLLVGDELVDDHGGWSYTTVLADTSELLATTAQRESVELRWVPEHDVSRLPLHPGFAATWPRLHATAVSVVVDLANVLGSRPDGWWRNRVGSSAALLAGIARLAGRTLAQPDAGFVRVARLTVVVEGAARGLADDTSRAFDPRVRVVAAGASGDDEVVEQARSDLGQPPDPSSLRTLVVTADRGLRARLPFGVSVAGPSWLRDAVDRIERRGG